MNINTVINGAFVKLNKTTEKAVIASAAIELARYNTSTNQWENVTEWVSVVFSGALKDVAAKLLANGSACMNITGNLDASTYTSTKDGNVYANATVFAESVDYALGRTGSMTVVTQGRLGRDVNDKGLTSLAVTKGYGEKATTMWLSLKLDPATVSRMKLGKGSTVTVTSRYNGTSVFNNAAQVSIIALATEFCFLLPKKKEETENTPDAMSAPPPASTIDAFTVSDVDEELEELFNGFANF
jgi:single-stranded DNA-binding protein